MSECQDLIIHYKFMVCLVFACGIIGGVVIGRIGWD